MPLPGGPSDKAGNSYERRWTVFALLDLLEGRAQTLRIEIPGEDGIGSEFRLMVNGVAEWHQAKRQRAAGPWTVSALVNEDVLQAWQPTLVRGEHCVFVCSTGAQELHELIDRARSADSWDEFKAEFLSARVVRASFDRLQRAWDGFSDEDVHAALQQITVRSVGEADLAAWINDRLRLLVTGADPATTAAVLAQLADDSVHRELSDADVWDYLADPHGIAPRNLSGNAEVVQRVAASADSYLARLRRLHIGGHELLRPHADAAIELLHEGRRVVLAGAAGAGKSVAAGQVVTTARQRRWPVLVVSADRLPDTATTAQLGAELELPDSPAIVLAGVAAGRDALLVIDQLDAVSVASGRHPEHLTLIAELLREARSYPQLRVLLVCRQFDIDNDRDLRTLVHDDDADVVAIGDLDDEQIKQALAHAGLPTALPPPLVRLLAVPLHLALYVDLALAGVRDVDSVRTLTQLYDRYWDTKRTACRLARGGTDEWLTVVERLVQRMNDRQELTVPKPVVDDLDEQVTTMASEGVITVEEGRVAFFHETFFDYCFARQFVASGKTLRDLLTGSEQDLFRRAQVRQVLAYQRTADPTAYLSNLQWLLTSPDVRHHLKALVIALLGTVTSPTSEEWRLLRPLAEDPQSPLHLRLWQAVRSNPAWFPVLDAEGAWTPMLKAGGELADRAIWTLSGAAPDHATRVCDLLAGASRDVWPSRRPWFLLIADVHRARELVELVHVAIDEGDFNALDNDLSRIIRQLAKTEPAWAAEVLGAIVRRTAADPSGSPFNPADRFRARSRDLANEIEVIATTAPAAYVEQMLPQLLDAMGANARPDWSATELDGDALWSHHVYRSHASLSDILFDAMGDALAALAEADPEHAATVFTSLREEPYESAAFLLARGYAGNPTVFADDAAAWLAATPGARHLGYSSSPAWVTRELVSAITPHCSQPRFAELVDALLYYAPPHERTHDGLQLRGLTELGLLNGIDPARRPTRATRRLAELRRKFNGKDVDPPQGVTVGVVPPPIPEDRARRMSDRQWLSAMQRYDASDATTRRAGRNVGDAWSQAQVLEAVTKDDPQRFARLLLQIPQATAEAYTGAILRGLQGAHLGPELLADVCRHARNIGDSDTDYSLVRLIETHAPGPLDDELITMVTDIATSDRDSPDSEPDESSNGDSHDDAAPSPARSTAALAIGKLISEEPARLPLVEPALRQLLADPQTEVRAAAVAALVPLLYSDADLALELFDDATDQASDDLLSSRYVEQFVHHAIQRRRYADIAEQLQAMRDHDDAGTRQAAARQLTLASYYDPDLDDQVDALLADPDDTVRAAVVTVFADNITYQPRRDRTIAVISTAFHDSAKTVREAAERAFYHLRDEHLGAYDTLITAFANSPALDDGAAAVLHTLENSRQPLPATALDLCEKFIATHQADIDDISTHAAADVTYITRIALRIHAQHTDIEVRRRSLDLIDQLVVLRAHNIESELDAIER